MFRSKTAWFSSSVPKDCLKFWILEGGTITDWRSADYLFSADATCLDTLRIFESKDYIWNKVTVFHSLFLSTCEKRLSVKSVCIGHYVLPPVSVQNEVRKVVGRLIWEREDEQEAEEYESLTCLTEDDDSQEGEEKRSESETSDTAFYFRSPLNSTDTEYVSIDNLQKYSGNLCDLSPGCFRYLQK